MVSEEKLREWIKQKMQEGVREERIKNSLRETGHDPSLVDDVRNPFEDGGSGVEEETRQGEEEPGSVKQGGEETESRTPGEGDFERPGSGDIESPEREKKTGFDIPDIPPRAAAAAGVLLLLVLLGAGIYFMGPEIGFSVFNSGAESSEKVATSSNASSPEKCDVGVRINSIRQKAGAIVVEATVFGGSATTSMKLYDQEGLVGAQTREFSGTSEFRFESRGYTAVFKPLGCSFQDRLTVG